MRAFASVVAVALCAACSQPSASTPSITASVSTSATPSAVDPARVERVRGKLPAGYEFGSLPESPAPVTLWGLGAGWVADPPACSALADPAGDAAVRGWSASGAGGIVYAVVAAAQVALDPSVVRSCDTWTMASGHTSGVVTLVDAPAIDGAATLGMTADATNTVEGGIETHSHAETFVAYLGDHTVWVTVVTDPGASATALAPGTATDLLVATVAAIRS